MPTACVSAGHFQQVNDPSLQRDLFKHSVQIIVMEVFSYCNRRCRFCPNSSGLRQQQHYLDEDIYISVLSELEEINYSQTLLFHRFNEPLADPIIFKRIRQAKSFLPYAFLRISTNGDYLDRRCLDNLVSAGISKIAISIYGPNNGEYIEDYILDRMNRKANELRLSGVSWDTIPGAFNQLASVYSTASVIILGRNFDKVGTDRGKLVDIKNQPIRSSPCVAPITDLNIDYTGNVLPCCNIYADDDRHKKYIVGNLHDGRSIFEHYTDKEMITWRRALFQFYPGFYICRTCSDREIPNLAVKENIEELNALYGQFWGLKNG